MNKIYPANTTKDAKPSFSIIIPCYNEEQNIGQLLRSISQDWNEAYCPNNICVFSSACHDRTEEIVRAYAKSSQIQILLRTEKERSGKCHAINKLLEMVGDVDVVILISSDIQVSAANLIRILDQFRYKDTGVVAGRPVPVCDKKNMAYRVSKVLWDIHHFMVNQSPKSTEVTAFRNLGFRLDETSLVDEAEIEWNISQKGYLIKYCPSAVIYNKAPLSLTDHIRQRIRVARGHYILKKKKQYIVGSMHRSVRVNSLFSYLKCPNPDLIAFGLLLVIELLVMVAGTYQANVNSETDGTWDRIDSAKKKFE